MKTAATLPRINQERSTIMEHTELDEDAAFQGAYAEAHRTTEHATQQKHTPTPYYAKPTAGHETHGQTAIYSEQDGKTIAIVYDGEANAQFIVTACNSHSALVEALEDLKEQAQAVINGSNHDSINFNPNIKVVYSRLIDELKESAKNATAALTLAKGGK